MARIISVANQKGGVGKTTTVTALSSAFTKRGIKNLLIDTDPQCNSTDTYRAKIKNQATIFDLMQREATARETIQKTEYGDIIASDPLMERADKEFDRTGKEYILQELLEDIKKDYEYILIDTSPSLGIMLINALTASTDIVIPIIPTRYSLQGLSRLRDTILTVKRYTNSDLEILGIVLTMYQANTNLSKEVASTLSDLEKLMDTKMFESKIRMGIKVKEAESQKTPLFYYDDKCSVAEDYYKLSKEIEG